ncbi:MAG: EF-P lysine aminoacylase GenX, partial [Lentisphaerae bacterium]|nr:EF-P lysine aminoacylase GenX [Lentisphaerota bacterium]
GGLELANAFSELTDAAEQRARFEACAQERRALGRTAYAVDELFLDALAGGMPDCAGAAFGLDRFLILLAGARSMDDVLPFRE